MTMIQYQTDAGHRCLKDRAGQPWGVVREQAISSEVTCPWLRVNLTGGTLSYTSSGERTTFPVAIPRTCEFNTSGVNNT